MKIKYRGVDTDTWAFLIAISRGITTLILENGREENRAIYYTHILCFNFTITMGSGR
jgi:hypothetical protein